MSSEKTVPRNGLMNGSRHTGVDKSILPYDNYSSIKPCSHLKSVLDSPAKDNVFVTYRQAVKISQVISNDRYFTQRKDGTKVSNRKLVDLKNEALHCTECSLNNFYGNFICLQCPFVGCSTKNSNHAYKHFKKTQHFFGIDSSIGLLFCFMCGDYVNDLKLDKIRIEIIENEIYPKNNNEINDNLQIEKQNELNSNYSLPNHQAISGLKGFVNLGATCFMSSILQTFIHNPIIRTQFFNNDQHFFNCESANIYNYSGSIDATNACVTCSIDGIFKKFFASNSIEGFGITNLLLTAWYKKESLAGFQEQDAHEFWQFLLDEFHQDYERITNNNKSINESCHCLTHQTFGGELESSIECQSCNSITKTIDPTVDFSLEISRISKKQKQNTLYDCLDLFTKPEKLDVKYKCQNCGERTEAVKSLKINKNPSVLGIQLKKFSHSFKNETSSKVEIHVDMPFYLDISKYSNDENSTNLYELFAIVCHVGSVNTGHYITITKAGNGEWFKFDDSVISLMQPEEVSKANAYLLFYIAHQI